MIKKYDNLLNLNASITKDLFDSVDHPWEVLPLIKDYILKIGPTLGSDYNEIKENVWVHKSVIMAPTVSVNGPCIIGEGTELRQCAFIRGSAIIGKNCTIGNSTEVKNAIIFDKSECPHYNYIGDAILGEHAHTGAGVILSNVKADRTNVSINDNGEKYETGLRKMSGIIGDYVELGCNSVVCPGTIIYSHTNVYPLTRVRGIIGPNKIVKSMENIIDKETR
jgi:NDP-sugar pyrophosphorylase family protein